MFKKDKELNNIIDSIFFVEENGISIVNEDGKILKSNQKFDKIVSSLNNSGEDNICEYISSFSFAEGEKVCNINGYDLVVKIKLLEYNKNTYYIVYLKEQSEDNLLKIMYESAIQSLTDGMHIADKKGKLRIYNNAQGLIEGYKPADVINNNIQDIYKLDENSSLLLKVQKDKKPINDVRQTYYTQHGHRVDVVTSVMPLFHQGELIGSAAVVKDYSKMIDLIERNFEKELQSKKGANYKNLNNKMAEDVKTYYNFDDIITKNRALLETISWAKLSAKNDSSVLIYGETGTGKELFAQSIHSFSNRKDNPFLAINCAAIPETLLESLLFGTTKGAFTGSVDKAGLFEQANGGTIFLDEINSMPMMLQAKLLRVLEEKKVVRLGDTKSIVVDVRIISSCNNNPRDDISNNTLRNDLFFRLAVMYLIIPPLRDRKEDIDLLCQHFINVYNEKFNKNIISISDRVRRLFYESNWPGNVRELRHIIESSMNVVDKDCKYIDLQSIPSHYINNNVTSSGKHKLEKSTEKKKGELNIDASLKNNNVLKKIKENEYSEIVNCLIEANGNVAEAARLMGISRQKMHYRIKKYHIK